MKNPRVSTGPASARGRARAAQKQMEHAEKYAPGLSLDMPDEPKGTKPKGMKKGGMPDLTGDGKVTRADVLKGRGVFKKGGAVKSSASRRADGIASKGKTRCKMV